ncbi:pentapeptide repeat-containing protein [Streptomyces sp. NBC_01262]|uniref:pentapeptide repeat-containing protein n=1 Tax=Streptomyces sp. NBC_01262 TaxID=2903803 RepID=UPI002E2F48C6|nr:pentapeptide repeat-containing protein [Streptomyces sp. NBC_01262]
MTPIDGSATTRRPLLDTVVEAAGVTGADQRRFVLVALDALGRTCGGETAVPGTDCLITAADAAGTSAAALAGSALGLRTLALIEMTAASSAVGAGRVVDSGKGQVVALVDGWEVLRESGQEVDLSGADLRRACLRGADLRGINGTGARFDGAELVKADLRDALLCDAGFSGADLSRAGLWAADLRRADLRRANLSHADLRHSIVTGAAFRGAEFWACYTWGIDLDQAHTDGCAIERADRRG